MIEVTDLGKRYGESWPLTTCRSGWNPVAYRISRAERRRDVHDDAAGPGPGPSRDRHRHHHGPALRRPGPAVADGGSLLEAKATHPGRSAYHHLLYLTHTQSLPCSRADAALALVGLTNVAHKRTGDYSPGMSQRAGVAATMLGDPRVLLLDEPVNGLPQHPVGQEPD